MDGSFNPSNSKNRGHEVNPDCWGTNHSVNLKQIIQYPGWSSNIASCGHFPWELRAQKMASCGRSIDLLGQSMAPETMDFHTKYFGVGYPDHFP
jgi:hypothetical protein